jgi:hypothetical protein
LNLDPTYREKVHLFFFSSCDASEQRRNHSLLSDHVSAATNGNLSIPSTMTAACSGTRLHSTTRGVKGSNSKTLAPRPDQFRSVVLVARGTVEPHFGGRLGCPLDGNATLGHTRYSKPHVIFHMVPVPVMLDEVVFSPRGSKKATIVHPLKPAI